MEVLVRLQSSVPSWVITPSKKPVHCFNGGLFYFLSRTIHANLFCIALGILPRNAQTVAHNHNIETQKEIFWHLFWNLSAIRRLLKSNILQRICQKTFKFWRNWNALIPVDQSKTDRATHDSEWPDFRRIDTR